MKKKLIIVIAAVLVLGGAGGAYKFVLAPAPAKAGNAPKPHIEGELYAVSPEFVVNLAGGHYGKVSVALLFTVPPAYQAAGEGASGPPPLVQADAVRAVITDALTGLSQDDLIARAARHRVEAGIRRDLNAHTDVKVTSVLFTDVVVQ
jgi:flagellar basal body-associated protein FliL